MTVSAMIHTSGNLDRGRHRDSACERWRAYHALQQPRYEDRSQVLHVTTYLRRAQGLVAITPIRCLKARLKERDTRKAFPLHVGDCADKFTYTNASDVMKRLRLIYQLVDLIEHKLALPVATIGRMTGQYAKPRSYDYETRHDTTLPVYRGDIINGPAFTRNARRHSAARLLTAYHKAQQTIFLINSLLGHQRQGSLINAINPNNIVLITRLGAGRAKAVLPPLIKAVVRAQLNVQWVSDPMDGNTIVSATGVKTCDIAKIIQAITETLEIQKHMGSCPAGLSLAAAGDDVTECVGGQLGLSELELGGHYEIACAPRLNSHQSLEVVSGTTDRMVQTGVVPTSRRRSNRGGPSLRNTHKVLGIFSGGQIMLASNVDEWLYPRAVASNNIQASRCLEILKERCEQECSEFACLLERVDAPARVAWVGIGITADIVCHVKGDTIVSRLCMQDRILAEQVHQLKATELPYIKLFAGIASLLRMSRSLYCDWMDGEHLSQLQHLRWFGGWQYLSPGEDVAYAARFTLPQMMLRITYDKIHAFNWGHLESSKIEDIGRAIHEAAQSTQGTPTATRMCDNFVESSQLVPDMSEYFRWGNNILTTIAQGDCEKVVLSRKRVMRFSNPIDALEVYSRISSNNSGHAFQYMFSWRDLGSWIGISPELLLDRYGDTISTKPLAGSRKRGSSVLQDETERQQLLASEKEHREHDLAACLMFRQLRMICQPDSLRITQAKEVLQLSYIQHLATEMKGKLQKPFDTFDVLSCIYPPATILGSPEIPASRIVKTCEPFARGFFTGALGSLSGHEDCEFALCVRTSLIKGNELHIFAGSGYVRGAHPEEEWNETDTKMRPFVEVSESYSRSHDSRKAA